jgi:hypothetical protein
MRVPLFQITLQARWEQVDEKTLTPAWGSVLAQTNPRFKKKIMVQLFFMNMLSMKNGSSKWRSPTKATA